MKKKTFFLNSIFCSIMVIFACNISFAQTSMDTVKTGKANDPMVVNPGQTSDSMAMRPGKTNDDMAAFTDTGFISKNMVDNMMEIKLAKLGQIKGTSARIKRAAALMVNDHTIILNDLKKLAAKKGVSPGSYRHDMSSMPADIAAGNDFDKNWTSEMLSMHEAKIAELENTIQQSSDADIKAAASKALLKIKVHRDMLMKINGTRLKSKVA